MVVLGIIYILVILKQFIDPGSKSCTCMEKNLKHVEAIKQLYCKVIKSPNFQSTMSFFLIKKVSCHEQEHEHHIHGHENTAFMPSHVLTPPCTEISPH